MKKLLFFLLIIFILVILGVAAAIINRNDEEVATDLIPEIETEGINNRPTQLGDSLLGQIFTVPGVGQNIKLSNNIVDYGSGNNLGSVIYLPEHAVAVMASGEDYIAAPIAVNTGGSGTFVYLVLFQKEAGQYNQVNEVLLGDRLKIESFSAVGASIEAIIFDRVPGEPYSAVPTQRQIRFFDIRDGQLEPRATAVREKNYDRKNLV